MIDVKHTAQELWCYTLFVEQKFTHATGDTCVRLHIESIEMHRLVIAIVLHAVTRSQQSEFERTHEADVNVVVISASAAWPCLC